MAELKLTKTQAEEQIAAEWQSAKSRLPGPADIRDAAFRRFEAAGLPHRRVEEWKYTDLRTLMRDAKPLAPAPGKTDIARAKSAGGILGEVATRRVVFVNGVFAPELSDLAALEPGLKISSLADALARGDAEIVARLGAAGPADGDVAFALNTAFMGDGAVIEVSNGAQIARPIQLVFAFVGDAPATAFPRSLVVVGEGASVTLVDSHEGPDGIDYQVNAALGLVVGNRATVEHLTIGAAGNAALLISTLTVTIGKAVHFTDFTFTIGGAVNRNQAFVRCDGTGSTLGLYGAKLLRGRQHADNTLVLDHAVAGCQSREIFKSVLDDESRGVFQGKIVVRPDAQKTDARMMSNALLLSPEAEADNKPELEIFADDVQCGHGATAGALSEELKFYLMARGIPEKQAETLLIQSFVAEAIEALRHEGIREALNAATMRWLDGRK
jgi:Fe-S cluster assembly protein SufD